MVKLIEGRGWEGLPEVSKTLYKSTYFKHGEDYEAWVNNRVRKYQNDDAHGDRMVTYIKNYWYHPSTPISSGAGLPISCYISHIPDSREGIFEGYHEGMWLGAEGGGRGVYWGDVGGAGRPIGISESVLTSMTWSEVQKDVSIPKSAGTVPFFGPSDRLTYSISQAGTRRSTEAVYLPINHVDILDMIEIRSETGDSNRRMPNLHHGVCISDAFMHAVENLEMWDLVEPSTGKVVESVDAYDLFMDLLTIAKTETGEPFILFVDTVNNTTPIEYNILGHKVSSTNICTEVTLYTDKDNTAVCNLGSCNVEYFDEFSTIMDQFIADISDFHDNVNEVFLEMTSKYEGMKAEAFRRARNSVINERNIGIGWMGWHSLCQRKGLPLESPMAVGLNRIIAKAMRSSFDKHQDSLGVRCPMNAAANAVQPCPPRRNIHGFAIAPTMSISNLCNLTSSGIEPQVSNAYVKKLIQGTFRIRNKYLERLIISESTHFCGHESSPDDWIDAQWESIVKAGGSVQHLDWMTKHNKDVFKTAFEIDQRYLIQLAAGRQYDEDGSSLIDQSQSLNIFLPADCSYEELYLLHMIMWKSKIKSRYYIRSEPETSGDTGTKVRKELVLEDDACVSCT